MTNRNYANEITKEYLKKLGVQYVSPDGKYVIKNGKLAKINKGNKKPYDLVGFYDPDIRASVSAEERKPSTGTIALGVHVLNYVWNNADKPAGMVIDHVDNDPTNNDISNLQCITQQENLTKERPDWNTSEIKCQMKKPRSFYEDKLAKYEALYEAAKQEHNADLCHSLRGNISQTKARIRYWNSHKEEYFEYLEAKNKNINDKQIWKLRVKLRQRIADKKKFYKEKGDLKSWRACCQLAKEVDDQPANKILQICEKLGIKLNNAEQSES